MKFDRSNKFDFCYYGQVNSLRLKSSVASKWASKHLLDNIYFAGGGIPHYERVEKNFDLKVGRDHRKYLYERVAYESVDCRSAYFRLYPQKSMEKSNTVSMRLFGSYDGVELLEPFNL